MLVQSERLGPIEIEDSSVIELPGGLLGFETAQRFALVAADDSGAYCWLQSVDDPGLSFLACVPGFFFPEYEPDVPESDAAAIDLRDVAEAQLMCLVTIAEDAITANLMGPLVLNLRTRLARQVVLADQGWTTKEPLGGR